MRIQTISATYTYDCTEHIISYVELNTILSSINVFSDARGKVNSTASIVHASCSTEADALQVVDTYLIVVITPRKMT